MDAFFPWYWKFLGLPLSRLKGILVDRVPFSLVELMIWVGVTCSLTLLAFVVTKKWNKLRTRRGLRLTLVCMPILLIFMGMGQGAFPWSLAPSAWRTPIATLFPGPALPYSDFKSNLRQREHRLFQTYSNEYYQSITEPEILHGCNLLLDSVLAELNLQPGRSVGKMKPMGPLTTLLGLSYGGPAFHDPFFGEMAMIQPQDHPAPHYWRLIGTCHEVAHAKGFTREMDAEILTQLALDRSSDTRYRMLGDIMFMRKSGERLHYPAELRREILQMRDSLEHVERTQPLVRFLRKVAIKSGFQNDGAKYGSRVGANNWDPKHAFYATVMGLTRKADEVGSK